MKDYWNYPHDKKKSVPYFAVEFSDDNEIWTEDQAFVLLEDADALLSRTINEIKAGKWQELVGVRIYDTFDNEVVAIASKDDNWSLR